MNLKLKKLLACTMKNISVFYDNMIAPGKDYSSYLDKTTRKAQNIYIFYNSIIIIALYCFDLIVGYESSTESMIIPIIHNSCLLALMYLKKYRIFMAVSIIYVIVPIFMALDKTEFLSAPFVICHMLQIAMNSTRSKFLLFAGLAFNLSMYKFYFEGRIMSQILNMDQRVIANTFKVSVRLSMKMDIANLLGSLITNYISLNAFQKQEILHKENTQKNQDLKIHKDSLQKALDNLEVAIMSFSHELKNSLNGVLGNISLALETHDPLQITKCLKNSQACGQILEHYINNILDSSGLANKSVGMSLSPIATNMQDFCDELWKMMSELARNKRLKFSLNIEPGMPLYMNMDRQKVMQCVMNLGSNAVKFTEQGIVRISVFWSETVTSTANFKHYSSDKSQADEIFGSSKQIKNVINNDNTLFDQEDQVDENFGSLLKGAQLINSTPVKKFIYPQSKTCNPNNYRELSLFSQYQSNVLGTLRFSVLDTGCGIPQQYRLNLFKKYSKAQRSHRELHKGTGLGLWVTKKIIRHMNGDVVVVESQEGQGSVFDLTIPTSTADQPSDLLAASSSEAYSPKRIDLNAVHQRSVSNKVRIMHPITGKVLVADDDSFNVELMCSYLKKLNLSYDAVYNGEALVNKVKEAPIGTYSLILTDNNMPKLDGVEAAKEIGEYLRCRGESLIPVIVISGGYNVRGYSKNNEDGIISLVMKPVQFNHLKSLLYT